MCLRERLKPRGETRWNFFVPSLQCFNPGQLALQRGREVDRRPSDVKKAFGEAGRGQAGVLVDSCSTHSEMQIAMERLGVKRLPSAHGTADIYAIAKNCRTSLEMIEKLYRLT